jgi:hypothetical protein
LSLCEFNFSRAFAILGDSDGSTCGIDSGGSLSDGGTITTAFEVVFSLKVEILKLDDEVINGGERVAALTGEGEYARV